MGNLIHHAQPSSLSFNPDQVLAIVDQHCPNLQPHFRAKIWILADQHCRVLDRVFEYTEVNGQLMARTMVNQGAHLALETFSVQQFEFFQNLHEYNDYQFDVDVRIVTVGIRGHQDGGGTREFGLYFSVYANDLKLNFAAYADGGRGVQPTFEIKRMYRWAESLLRFVLLKGGEHQLEFDDNGDEQDISIQIDDRHERTEMADLVDGMQALLNEDHAIDAFGDFNPLLLFSEEDNITWADAMY